MSKSIQIEKLARIMFNYENSIFELDKSFDEYIVEDNCDCGFMDDYACFWCEAKEAMKKAEYIINNGFGDKDRFEITWYAKDEIGSRPITVEPINYKKAK